MRGPARAAAGLMASLTVLALLGFAAAAAPAKPSGQDRALATSAVLQVSDFPAGWTAGPRTDNAAADRIRGGIADCRGYQQLVVALRRQAEGTDNFLQGSAAASSTVVVSSTASAARSIFGQLSSSTAQRCLQRFLGIVTPASFFIRGAPSRLEGATVHSIPVARAGDQSAGFEVVITVSAAGLTAPVYQDVVVTRVGRGVADLGFVNPNTPLSPVLRDALVHAVAGRLASAR